LLNSSSSVDLSTDHSIDELLTENGIEQNYDGDDDDRTKRSDINSRLLAMQAAIDLAKYYNKHAPGFGKFDFKNL
jgi:hypothetical protein